MYIKESVTGRRQGAVDRDRQDGQAGRRLVVVRYGDTMVLVTAVANKSARAGVDFMPLTVEYTEKTAAAGKIPGGYFKREGRPTEREVLTCRLIDRPSRPLFPKMWRNETQVIGTVLVVRQGEPVGRAGDDRRVGGAAHLGHPVGGAVRGRPHRARRRGRGPQVHRQPDLRRVARPPTSTSSSPPTATPSSWSRAAPRSSPKTS